MCLRIFIFVTKHQDQKAGWEGKGLSSTSMLFSIIKGSQGRNLGHEVGQNPEDRS